MFERPLADASGYVAKSDTDDSGAIWMRFFFATSLALLNGQICITLSQDPLHDRVEIGGGWDWVGLSGEFPNCLTVCISCFRQIIANLGAAAGQDVSFWSAIPTPYCISKSPCTERCGGFFLT